jgi:hypothetical protein
MTLLTRLFTMFLWLPVLVACTSTSPTDSSLVDACTLTEPVWAQPPEDAAVQGSPAFGYYFINEEQSIWAAAWWADQEAGNLRASGDGIKTGWFRPAGAELQITGQRLDAEAPPLEAHVPCCYPTRFQATGLFFPTEGCWEVTARADDSEISFIVQVAPG